MKTIKKNSYKIKSLLLSILMLFTMLTPYMKVLAAGDQTTNQDIVRSLALSYKLKGSSSFVNLTAPYQIPDSSLIDSFRAMYSFSILDNVNPDTGAAQRTVHSGDFYMIDLPAELRITTATNGVILGNAGRPIANYTFIQDPDQSWKIKIEFTNYVDDPNEFDIHGNMQFDFNFDLSTVAQGTTKTILIPIDDNNGINLSITVPVPAPTTPISLTKSVTSYNHQTRDLIWNVRMLPETGKFSGCTFTDTLDTSKLDLKSIKHGNVNLVQGVDYTYDNATGLITYLIPSGRDGSSYQNIIITTTAKRDIYGNLTATTINNTANLSGGDAFVNIDSNQSSYTITPNWINKSGAVYDGNKIQWTINANTTNQGMYNAVITDNLQANLILDKASVKLGATTIPVYDDAHTPANSSEVYGVYISNPDSTSQIKIYLPRSAANASYARQTITFITSVDSPDNVTSNAPTYNNSAVLDANFIGDNGEGTISGAGSNTVGVGVPNVAIIKGNQSLTAEDKRNGTITWTISAASNLSNYGKSQIVDTLPNDQNFLADEIYWGNQKIDSTTEPKADISGDGRTLTITFANDNALRTNQTFTVKTKIKEDVYGQNINRDFTNQAKVTIFSKVTDSELATATDGQNVRIQNSVITKTSSEFNGNTSHQGENPKVNFSIVINNNLMELNNLKITDDLSQILTEFKKSNESTFNQVNGVKWTYVPGSIKITKTAGTRDTFDLNSIADSAIYTNDLLSVDFGNGVTVNDKYTITFTAELDVAQNSIFEQNGVIRCRGNIAGIEAGGLSPGIVNSNPTVSSGEIKNEILGKSGIHLVAEQQALWTINLNQHNSSLSSTRVVDVLPLGLTLDPTSIKLYTDVIGSNGSFVTGSQVESQGVAVPFTYTYQLDTDPGMEGRYILTVNLPDNNKAYILRFATDIDNSLLGKQVNNSAFYVGENSQNENTTTSNITIAATVGGGSTTKTSITVNKYNKDNSELINGSTFTLNWLRNGDPNDPVFVRNLTVTNGSVIFRGLTIGEKYTITETKAPTGYVLDNPLPVDFTASLNSSGLNFYDSPIKNGSWHPEALKDLSGKNFVRPFHFEILEGDAQVFSGVTNTLQPDGRYSVVYSLSDGIASDQILTFSDDHVFPDGTPDGTEYLALTKTFVMKEVNDSLPGYVLDSNAHNLIVKVYNVKGQGDLKIQIEDENGKILSDNKGNFTTGNIPVFFNTYSAKGEFQFEINKILKGNELSEGQFTFDLYQGDNLIDTATNGKGILNDDGSFIGSVDFNKLEFTQNDVGVKTYTIVERNTGMPGYTYDDSSYKVNLRITDNDDGTITTSIENIQKTKGQSTVDVQSIDFINSYTALDFTVNKYLKGKKLEDKEFSFILQRINAEDGSSIGNPIIAKNDAMGNVVFPDYTFISDDVGNTFYFDVTELNEKKANYTYDTSVYRIQATISQNTDGTLSIEQNNYKVLGSELVGVDKLAFNNSYKKTMPQTGGQEVYVLTAGISMTFLGFLILSKRKNLKSK